MSLIGQSIGNYRVVAKLGEGGMGAVYLGEHPLIGKRVAIKVLLEELAAKQDVVQRFFNEAKAVNDIGHSNIVDIVDFGRIQLDPRGPETVYLIMEFLEGESLAQRIHRQALTVGETLHVMEQCCSALHASHAKGIVHRDLKPENIFVCARGNDPLFVKILDFGIAKLSGDGTNSKTRTGAVIGTPYYMSPEQCEGRGLVDHRSDVYSIGVVLYELLTGGVPFAGEGFGEILVAQMTRTPDPPSRRNPAIRPEMDALVLHALEKDRNLRFQSMADLAAALRNPVGHMQAYRPIPGYNPAALGGQSTMSFDSTPTVTGGRQPVSTTLSGSSGQYTRAELGVPSGRGGGSGVKMVIGLGLVGLLVGGGVTAWSLKRSPAPTPEAAIANPKPQPETNPTPVVPQPAQPRDEFVSIKITSTPAGAEVVRADGEAASRTPALLKVKRGAPSFDVALRLAGYKTSTLHVETERDSALEVTLPAVPAEPAVVATTAPEPKKRSSSSGSSGKKSSSKKPAAATSGGKKATDSTELELPAFMRK